VNLEMENTKITHVYIVHIMRSVRIRIGVVSGGRLVHHARVVAETTSGDNEDAVSLSCFVSSPLLKY